MIKSFKKIATLVPWGITLIAIIAAIGFNYYRIINARHRLGDGRTLFFADGGSTLSALLYVAYEKTFFFTQKVNFHLSYYPSGKDALAALTTGKVDLATVADIPIVHSILNGKDFVVLATIATSRTSLGMLALESIKTPDDLRGKKIGYYPGTNSEYFLSEFLIKNGISRSEVVLVPINPDEVEDYLGGEKIQAVAAYDPHLTGILKLLGNRAKVFFAPDVYTFSWNVVASRQLLQQPVILENIVRALHVAEKYVKENPQEAIEITSRYLKGSPSRVKDTWNSMDLEVELLQSLIVNMEREAKWAGESIESKTTTIPDFGKYFT